MDFSVVLNHLQNQFSGQMVLYANDIAKVLGKSEKSVAHLIARGQLPFKVKMLGGMRCVDIFQVAQWLASDQEVAQEVIAGPKKPSKSGKGVVAVKGPNMQKRPAVAPAKPAVEAQPKAGGMIAAILAMRHDAQQAMDRFANGLHDVDEMAFMHEVLEQFFYPAEMLAANFVVTLKTFAPRGYQSLLQESRSYFPSKEEACIFLTMKLVVLRDSKRKRVSHLVMESEVEPLFHAIASNARLDVVKNLLGLELPGL